MQNSKELSDDNEGMVADGFSSEEELYVKKDLQEENKKEEEKEQQLKEKVKFVLPPPQEIKSKAYSLLPDKATGWGIKTQQPNPIPITFNNRHLDNLVTKMLTSQRSPYQVVYLGPRYQNTFYAYRDKSFKFPYSHITMPKNIKYKKRPFLGQNPEIQETIYFDSIFESGNLDLAVKVNRQEYDLFVRVDSNTRGHFNWFCFVVAGLKPNQKYRLNICNMERGFCLYTRGMKPYMKSLKKKGDTWKQSGINVAYSKKDIRFAKHFNFQVMKHWTLSFQIQTDEQNDQIQIAYCVPYTYSNMLRVISELKQTNERKNIIKQTNLCMSLGGLPIPLLTITEQSKQKNEDKFKNSSKKCIIICGRVHPGESNGSFMMEGFLKFICGDSKQARCLRTYIVFKIVPMLNPDGVVLGNYRTGLSGRDFNREYRNPDKDIFPQVYFFKKLVTEMKLQYKGNLFMFLDLHGHSTKKNVFAYGPQFPITDKFYYQSRIFAKMLEKQNKMFRYHSCVFKVSECKLATARAILLRKINIPLTYTIEASNGFYHDKQKLLSVAFVAEEWLKMGVSIGRTICQYVQIMLSTEKVREDCQKAKNEATRAKRDKSKSKSVSVSPVKKESLKNLISAKQDARIQKIYEQILQQQSQHPQEPNSDDNISQGSSDKQDDKDDLSKKQLQTLFNSIKNNNKLGKNRVKKGNKLEFDVEELENQHQEQKQQETQKVEEVRPRFRIKNIELFEKTLQPIEVSEQVFIVDRSPFARQKIKKPLSVPKYLSERKQRSFYHIGRTEQTSTTKIVNYKFQEQRNRNECFETISIFPSFSSKNKNTIVLSQRGEPGTKQGLSQRSIVISNVGNTPRQIKLMKGKDFDGQLGLFGLGKKNELDKKLQHLGINRTGKQTYNKFNRTGFFHDRSWDNQGLTGKMLGNKQQTNRLQRLRKEG